MQLKSRLLQFFLILVLSACGIVSLILLEVFGNQSHETLVLVPDDADWIVEVDPEKLLKDEAYNLLFESKDEQLIQSLSQTLKQRIRTNREKGPLAINYSEPVLIFASHKDGETYNGILLQTVNSEVFKSHIGKHLRYNQAAAVRAQTALILTGGTHQKKTQQLAEYYLKHAHEVASGKIPDQGFVKIAVHAPHPLVQGDIDFHSYFTEQKLIFKGAFTTEKPLPVPSFSLKKKGLFMSSSLIPAHLEDSLKKWLPVGSCHFPPLRSISLDYSGMVVAHSAGGMLFLPQMNVILEAKAPVSADSLLASVPAEWLGSNHTIQFPGTTYTVKQLNATTLFFGTDPSAIITAPQSSVMTIDGNLSVLTEVSGKSMLLGFLEVMPAYVAAKQFVNATEKLHFEVAQSNGSNYAINGALSFKPGNPALHSFFRLFAQSQLLD